MRAKTAATVQASLFFGILVTAVALLVLAVWDFTNNDQRLQAPVLWGLAVLAVAALGVFGFVFLLRQRESAPAATYLPPPTEATSLAPPDTEAPLAPAPRPMGQPTPTMAPAAPERVMVTAVVANPPPANAPSPMPEQIPGPLQVPDRKYGDVELLGYEVGDPKFRGVAPESGHGQHASRILCGDCGAFFTLFTGHARPIRIHCLECNKELGLPGTVSREANHVWVRCKLCGQYQPVLQKEGVRFFLCPTCGQRNGTSDLPSGTPINRA